MLKLVVSLLKILGLLVILLPAVLLAADDAAADNSAASRGGSSIISASAAVANRDGTGVCLQGGRVSDGTSSEVCFPMQTNVGDGQGEVVGEVCLSIPPSPPPVVVVPPEASGGSGSEGETVDGSSSSSSTSTTTSPENTLLLQVRAIDTTPSEGSSSAWELIETRVWVGNNAWNVPKLPDRSSVDVNQFPYVWPTTTTTTTTEEVGGSNTWPLPNPCTTTTTTTAGTTNSNNSQTTKTMVFVVYAKAAKTTNSSGVEAGDSEMVTIWGYEHLTRSVPAPWFDSKVLCDCTNNKEV